MNYTADGEFNTALVSPVSKKNWRTQVQYKVNPSVSIRYRLDAMWYDLKGPLESRGFLTFFDIFYKPERKKFSGNLRLQYFETDNYDSRIYAYENDVLYGFSIPAFSGKGYRYYINMEFDLGKAFSVWVKWAQTLFLGKKYAELGGGQANEGSGTDFRIQFRYIFQ